MKGRRHPMSIYVCAESALDHYRKATFPALQPDKEQDIRTLDDAAASLGAVNQHTLAGLGLPSPSTENPLHVLVAKPAARGRAQSVEAAVWGHPLPPGAFRKVSIDAFVSSPEFLFLQMARKLELVPLVELGMELCGTYRREAVDGTTSYNQPQLTTPRDLRVFLDKAGSAPGTRRAKQALKYIASNSASPFETIVYLLLCLPRNLGGYAMPRPELNPSIRFSQRGKQHTLRRSSCPDLYWEMARLDLECHGSAHEQQKRRTEDSMRRKALERMGIEVIELTYDEVESPKLFRAAVLRIAKKLGYRLRSRGENDFAGKEAALRETLIPTSYDEGALWQDRASLADADDESWEGEELPPEFESWEVYREGSRQS